MFFSERGKKNKTQNIKKNKVCVGQSYLHEILDLTGSVHQRRSGSPKPGSLDSLAHRSLRSNTTAGPRLRLDTSVFVCVHGRTLPAHRKRCARLTGVGVWVVEMREKPCSPKGLGRISYSRPSVDVSQCKRRQRSEEPSAAHNSRGPAIV